MSAHEVVILLIGGAVGIPAGMVAIALYNPIDRWQGRRGSNSAMRQRAALQAELEKVEKYRSNPGRLQEYLVARILFIVILWIGQEVIDGIIGAASNIQYGLALGYGGYNTSASLTAAGQALLSSILLTILLVIGIRTYRIYKNVRDYDTYKERMDRELSLLGVRIRESEALHQ
jgi:hypothetical protein